MEGKIALEEHFSTQLNNQYWDSRGEASRNGLQYTKDIEQRLLDPEQLLREMDRAGVEFCILSLTSPGVQSLLNKDEAVELARSSNDYAASIIKAHPNRFSAFAAVPLQDPSAAADELSRAVGELGFKGALINGYTNIGPDDDVRYLDAKQNEEFWEQVAQLQVPVYLHPREPLASQTRSVREYPELVGSAWAFAYETASHAIRLMLCGVFDRHPDLQVILGHLGEGLPFLLPRLQHRLDEQADGLKGGTALRRPSYYFSHNFMVTTSGHFHSGPFLEVVEQMGAERVLYSVDYPYEQMGIAARWFDDSAFGPHIKKMVGRDNARRALKLKLTDTTMAAVSGFSS